jgi:hypothetical protein
MLLSDSAQRENQYWYFLIGGQSDDTSGLIGNFYAYGQHCGDALDNALSAAIDTGYLHPEASEAARLDNLEEFEEPDDLVQLTELVFTGAKNYSFPLNTEEPEFISPTGIIKSTEDGQLDYEIIKPGFMAYRNEESDFFLFELVADKSKLIPTFFEALSFIPTPDTMAIHIKGHWEGGQSELWSFDLTNDIDYLLDFLTREQANTLDNGFIELSIFSLNGQTKLTLDEHKKILLQTKDEVLFADFGHNIMDLGFTQTTDLHSLEFEFYHWHYRPADSLDASDFRILLLDQGFNFIEKWDEDYGHIGIEQSEV